MDEEDDRKRIGDRESRHWSSMNNGVVVVFIHSLKSRPNPGHRSHIQCAFGFKISSSDNICQSSAYMDFFLLQELMFKGVLFKLSGNKVLSFLFFQTCPGNFITYLYHLFYHNLIVKIVIFFLMWRILAN